MADDNLIDIDLFIKMVEERPVVWNKHLELYKNRSATQQAWDEITMALNPGLEHDSERAKQGYENVLRKKWRYLRDQFSVELAKCPAGLEGKGLPKWPYFTALMFLRDVVVPRKNLRGKRPMDSPATSENNEDIREEVPITFDMEDDLYDPLQEEDVKPFQKKKKSSSLLLYTSMAQEEPSSLRNDDDDEHLYFFKSLLPHIRHIPRRQILSFRNRIQEIVEKYAYAPGN